MISLSTISLLYINIVLCFYVEFIFRHNEEHEKLTLAEQQLVINERFYSEMMNRQEETRALWHDIKKYVLAIECLVSKNNIEQARTQTEHIFESYKNMCYTVDSGNPIVDSILNHEMNFAKQNNTTLNLDLWIPSSLSIDATDLYVILGNTIDNAIEACSRLSNENQRIVDICLRMKNNILLYEISNPYMPNSTNLTNKKFHGYGLHNVEKCVSNNHGTMEIIDKDNHYTVTIFLNDCTANNCSV